MTFLKFFQLCNIWRDLHDWMILSFPSSLWPLLVTWLVYLSRCRILPNINPIALSGFSKTRFQSLGIFQWDIWLPVSHLSIHGQLASLTPRGRPAWIVGDDGNGREGRAEMPDPRLNGRDAGWVASESDGRLLHTLSLSCQSSVVDCKPEMWASRSNKRKQSKIIINLARQNVRPSASYL